MSDAEITVDLLGPIEFLVDIPSHTLDITAPSNIEIGVSVPLYDNSDEVIISPAQPVVVGYELWVDVSEQEPLTHIEFYTHLQTALSQDWVVDHNLGRTPTVHISDAANNQIFGSVRHITFNQITIHFAFPITGWAYCI